MSLRFIISKAKITQPNPDVDVDFPFLSAVSWTTWDR